MTVAEVLREARALYEEAPSHAGAMQKIADGSVCPILALCDVVGGSVTGMNRHPAYEALLAGMGIDGGMVDWNAEHSTAEVLAAFDRAIAAEGAVV